jgi:hypothetical protein
MIDFDAISSYGEILALGIADAVMQESAGNFADIHIAKNRQGALGRIGATDIGEQVRFESFDGTLPDWDVPAKTRRGFE